MATSWTSEKSDTTQGVETRSTANRVIRNVPWTQHALRQLKLLIPGAAITYYLRTWDEFWDILHGSGGSWAQSVLDRLLILVMPTMQSRTAAFGALVLGLTTISLFIYVLFLPLIMGEELNVRELLSKIELERFPRRYLQYQTWRASRTLSRLIPVCYILVHLLAPFLFSWYRY